MCTCRYDYVENDLLDSLFPTGDRIAPYISKGIERALELPAGISKQSVDLESSTDDKTGIYLKFGLSLWFKLYLDYLLCFFNTKPLKFYVLFQNML